MVNPIALAIPAFLLLIAAEAAWGWYRGMQIYRVNDAVGDLMCGVSSQLVGLATKIVSAGAYIAAWQHLRLFDLQANLSTWVITFLLVDFAYYLWHRWTHSMNLGWASHVVHHQSEEYNLAVALRQSMTSTLTSWPFYLPLALLGVPPLVALTCMALNTLYQFWIHTETVDRLGPLEWVLNTPSHHRVHHGVNPQYLDKNHAGVLIIWDRFFGTFEPEVERPVYGTVKKLDSLDPVWANVWWIDRMVRTAIATPRWQDKLGVFFRGPAFAPEGSPPVPVRSPEKYDPHGPDGASGYALAHFLPLAVVTTWILWVPRSPAELALPLFFVALGCLTLPALFERRRWFVPVELIRLFTLVGLSTLWLPLPGTVVVGLAALLSAGWVLTRARAVPAPAL